MKKYNFGLVIFGISVLWALFWGVLASVHKTELYDQVLSYKAFQESIWASDGVLMRIWALSPPVAAFLAATGLLIHSGTCKETVLKFCLGVPLLFAPTMKFGHMGHFRPAYIIGGTFILLFFFGVLWLWGKERIKLQGSIATAADLQLTGFVFLFFSAWFTCGIVSPYWSKATADQPPFADPIIVMIFLVIGWLFLFLSYLKRGQDRQQVKGTDVKGK